MRYIKQFENNNDINYKDGDYILIKKYYIDFWKSNRATEKQDVFKFAKIIGVKNKEYSYSSDKYTLEGISNNSIKNFYLPDSYFTRKLTKEEIEEFETKKVALKFNI